MKILLSSIYIMKKKCSMNTFLESVPLLYFLFFATIVHLGYFILIKDSQSIFIFCLVSIFVYLVIPNMVAVLAITLLFVDMLYIVNAKTTNEGFSGTVKFKDLSGVDISANEFMKKTLENSKDKDKDNENDNDPDKDPEDESNEGTVLEEVDEQSNKLSNVIEKIKAVSPEMVDSLTMLNSIDISELNKLINNMNKIATTISN